MANINGVFKIRRGTAASLAAVVLLEGEFGYATDTGDLKIGDGTTAFSGLGTIYQKKESGFVYGRVFTSTPSSPQNGDILLGLFTNTAQIYIAGSWFTITN